MKTKSNPSLRGVANAEAIHESTNIDCHDFVGTKSSNDKAKCNESLNKSRNDKNYLRFAICFSWIVSVAIFSAFTLCVLLYIYDPFWLFHKPIFRAAT